MLRDPLSHEREVGKCAYETLPLFYPFGGRDRILLRRHWLLPET